MELKFYSERTLQEVLNSSQKLIKLVKDENGNYYLVPVEQDDDITTELVTNEGRKIRDVGPVGKTFEVVEMIIDEEKTAVIPANSKVVNYLYEGDNPRLTVFVSKDGKKRVSSRVRVSLVGDSDVISEVIPEADDARGGVFSAPWAGTISNAIADTMVNDGDLLGSRFKVEFARDNIMGIIDVFMTDFTMPSDYQSYHNCVLSDCKTIAGASSSEIGGVALIFLSDEVHEFPHSVLAFESQAAEVGVYSTVYAQKIATRRLVGDAYVPEYYITRGASRVYARYPGSTDLVVRALESVQRRRNW